MVLCPDHPLWKLASGVVWQPADWLGAVSQAVSRAFTRSLQPWGGWPPLVDALLRGEMLGPRPLGFVAAALVTKVHQGSDHRYDLALETVNHPTRKEDNSLDVRLLPIVIDVAEPAAGNIPPHVEGPERVFLFHKLASAYAQSPLPYRVQNQKKALDYYLTALKHCEPETEPILWIKTRLAMANVYKERLEGPWRKNQQQAMEYYLEALGALEKTHARQPLPELIYRDLHGDLANNLGNLHRDFNPDPQQAPYADLHEAEDYFQLALRDRHDQPVKRAETLRNLGTMYLSMEYDRVDQAIATLLEASNLAKELRSDSDLALTGLNLGAAYACKARRPDGQRARKDARHYLDQAASIYQRLYESTDGLPAECRELVSVYSTQGGLEMDAGNFRAACEHFEQAARLVERGFEQEGPGLEPSAWMQIYSVVHEGCLASLAELDRRRVRLSDPSVPSDFAARAAYWAELGRSRKLDLWIQRHGLGHSPNDGTTQRVSPSRPMSPADMERLARESQAGLLTLRMTAWGACAVLITPEGQFAIRLFDSLLPKQFIDYLWLWYNRYHEARRNRRRTGPLAQRAIAAWSATVNDVLRSVGKALGRPLIDWLREHMPDTEQNPPLVVILPGQGFNLLPLHALCWEEEGRLAWADDYFAFSYVPSFQVLKARQAQRSITCQEESILCVRNPAGDPQMRGFEVLCDVVATGSQRTRTLGGTDAGHLQPATLETLTGISRGSKHSRGALEEHELVLLATHGHFDPADPMENSFLEIAPSAAHPRGLLTLENLFRLDLSRVQHVILAACETAIPEPTDPSGEQTSLAAAMLAAGAASAVGTLWEVEVGPTTFLIGELFRRFRQDGAGPRALRAAQRFLRRASRERLNAMLASWTPELKPLPETIGQHPFSHPSFWAAMIWEGAV